VKILQKVLGGGATFFDSHCRSWQV